MDAPRLHVFALQAGCPVDRIARSQTTPTGQRRPMTDTKIRFVAGAGDGANADITAKAD